MTLWKQRKVLASAYAWKRERESELVARIRIERAILYSLRTELAQLRQLEGEDLAARYGWESEAQVEQAFAEQRRFHKRIEDLFVEGILQGAMTTPELAPRCSSR